MGFYSFFLDAAAAIVAEDYEILDLTKGLLVLQQETLWRKYDGSANPKTKMDQAGYIYDETLATVLMVALQLGHPLLIEGAAGVGKTEIAKVMASTLEGSQAPFRQGDLAQSHPGE